MVWKFSLSFQRVLACLVILVASSASAQSPDLNNDGVVDERDLWILATEWHGRGDAPTPSPTPGGPETITVDLPDLPAGATPLEMVRIPAGSFQMGSNDNIEWSLCYPCEQPVHSVTIAYDFYMGKYEVTEAQWETVLGELAPYSNGPNRPVEIITWLKCQEFIAALNQLGQGSFRMPSEAEWEYASRAGTTTRFSFGDSDCSPNSDGICNLGDYAWFRGNNESEFGYGQKDVGLLPANPFGLHDMHGNVWEYCEDDWHQSYDEPNRPDDGSAWHDEFPLSMKVIRGGHYDSPPRECRSAFRKGVSVNPTKGFYGGLRLVMGVPAETPTPTPTNTPTATRTPDPAYSPTPTSTPLTVSLPNLPVGAIPLKMVLIPSGTFEMGSNDSWAEQAEQPVHEIQIASDFYIGRYEITQAQWVSVLGTNPTHPSWQGENRPVSYLSWNDCQEFLTALNDLGQGVFRLPSEAEWEYACRASTSSRYYFGDSDCESSICGSCALDNHAWTCGNIWPASGPQEVGSLQPNGFGLYDVYGNVEEWCEDDWHPDYDDTSRPVDGTPWIDTPRSAQRVLRGGFAYSRPHGCRSAFRDRLGADAEHYATGLRVVRER